MSSPNTVQEKGLYISTLILTPQSRMVLYIAERLNQKLVESAKSTMFHSNMSINVWTKAANTAVHLCNRIPTKSYMKTP